MSRSARVIIVSALKLRKNINLSLPSSRTVMNVSAVHASTSCCTIVTCTWWSCSIDTSMCPNISSPTLPMNAAYLPSLLTPTATFVCASPAAFSNASESLNDSLGIGMVHRSCSQAKPIQKWVGSYFLLAGARSSKNSMK